MNNLGNQKELLHFGPFRFDPVSGELFKGNEKFATLQPKVSATLYTLLANRGRVVDKGTLMARVWPDAHVEESNLSRNISELRKLIGADWIETIPRRGFRFRAADQPVRRSPWLLVTGAAAAAMLVSAGLWLALQRGGSAEGAPAMPSQPAFYVYRDAASAENHFHPTGYMGDCGDIEIAEADEEKPFAGRAAIRVRYLAKGAGPNVCPYQPPCRWAGVYFQHPPNNWGREARLKGAGFDLSAYRRLKFASRAERAAKVEFKVGGIAEPYGDSLKEGRSILATLGPEWREFEIDLAGADLRHIIGGFAWAASSTNNPDGVTFWLDEIRFERD